MADTKIEDLTADTAPSSDDLLVTVNDPAGTPANRKVTVSNLGVAIDRLTDNGPPQMYGVDRSITTGRFMSAVPLNAGNGTIVATGATGRMFLAPVRFGKDRTITVIGAECATAGAAGSVMRLGLYEDDGNGFPSTLVADWGTIDTDTTGFKTLSISETVRGDRWYWFAASNGVATCSMRGSSSVVNVIGTTTINGFSYGGVMTADYAYGTLPAGPINGATYFGVSCPFFFWS